MTSRRVGCPTEIKTTAARAVSSGDLHECPDGRTGVFSGSMAVPLGGSLVLHTCEHLELTAGDFAAKTAGSLANFDFATQQLVNSGGTVIGRYTAAKALSATAATVLLNDSGVSA